jgi:hypothetical protein
MTIFFRTLSVREQQVRELGFYASKKILQLNEILKLLLSLLSPFGVVTGRYARRPRNRGSIPGWGKGIFSSSVRQDKHRISTGFLVCGYRRLFSSGKETGA